jgi:hypothetical protein
MSLRTVALSFTAVVLFISGRPTVAKASPAEALDAAIDASDLNDQTESRCQGKLGAKLDTLIDALRAVKKNPTDRAIAAAKKKVKAAADIAEDRCPDRIGAPVGKKLDEVLDALDDAAGNDDGGGGGGGYVKAKFGAITVGNGTLDDRSVVELNPKNITLSGCKGRNVFMAMGIAPKGSDGYEWSSFDAAEVLYDPVTWKDGGVFRFYFDWLSEHDTANGQWTAKFGLYDADTKEELASKVISFTFTPPQDTVMDADSYNALVDALAGCTTDFSRLDLLNAQIANQRITSKQLGPILDQFANELIRLDAARAAVPRVTNKTAALTWANKFANSLLADDYRALCAP